MSLGSLVTKLYNFVHPALHTVHILKPSTAVLQGKNKINITCELFLPKNLGRLNSFKSYEFSPKEITPEYSFANKDCPLFGAIDNLPNKDSMITLPNSYTKGYTLNIVKAEVGKSFQSYEKIAKALFESDLINKQGWIAICRPHPVHSPKLQVEDTTGILVQFHQLPVYSLNAGRVVAMEEHTSGDHDSSAVPSTAYSRIVLRSLQHGLLMGEDVFEVAYDRDSARVILKIASNAKGCALITPFIPIAVQPSRRKLFLGMVNIARDIGMK